MKQVSMKWPGPPSSPFIWEGFHYEMITSDDYPRTLYVRLPYHLREDYRLKVACQEEQGVPSDTPGWYDPTEHDHKFDYEICEGDADKYTELLGVPLLLHGHGRGLSCPARGVHGESDEESEASVDGESESDGGDDAGEAEPEPADASAGADDDSDAYLNSEYDHMTLAELKAHMKQLSTTFLNGGSGAEVASEKLEDVKDVLGELLDFYS